MFDRQIPPRSFAFLGISSPTASPRVMTQGAPPASTEASSRGSSVGTWILVAAVAVGGWYAWKNREDLFGIKPAVAARRESPADYGDDEGDDPGWEPGEREARTKQTVDDLVGGAMLDDGAVGMDEPAVHAEIKRELKAKGYKLRPKSWGYVAARV